jgi:hypothetical protein
MRPFDVAMKVAWVASETDQLCMETGKLFVDLKAHEDVPDLVEREARNINGTVRYDMSVCEKADFVRRIIKDEGYVLAGDVLFPEDNSKFVPPVSVEAFAELLSFLPESYAAADAKERIFVVKGKGTSIERTELQRFHPMVTPQEPHPGTVSKWVKACLEARPASVASSVECPRMSTGYAAVVSDPTGAVALGLLRSGFRRIALVYSPHYIAPFPEVDACTGKVPTARALSYNGQTIKLAVKRIERVIVQSFIHTNFNMTEGPFKHLWTDVDRPLIPPAPVPQPLPSSVGGVTPSPSVLASLSVRRLSTVAWKS